MANEASLRLSPSDVLFLSSTKKKRLSEAQIELSERLRALNIAESLAIYSRCWLAPQSFTARAAVPPGYPTLIEEVPEGVLSGFHSLCIDFSNNNILSQYSTELQAPACILLIKPIEGAQAISSEENQLLKLIFVRLYSALLAIKRIELRSNVLLHAEGGSLDHFVRNCLGQIASTLLSHESASAFLPHRRMKQYLTVPAATSGLTPTQGLTSEETRQRLLISIGDPIASPIKTGKIEIFEDLSNPKTPENGDDNVSKIWNSIRLPIALQRDHVSQISGSSTSVSRRPEDPIGVLRVTNLTQAGAGTRQPRRVTWEDIYLLEFIAEVMFVLSRVSMTADRYENEIERTLHGFKYLISGVHQNLSLIDRALTSGIPGRERPMQVIEPAGRRFFSLSNVQNWISDATHFVEEMDFQFEKTTKGKLTKIESGRISTFHKDVLMVAVQNAKRAAKIYDRKNAEFNRLDEAGSHAFPIVLGNASAYISVLRNLFENSLKYAAKNVEIPKIEVSFDYGNGKYVLIMVRDFGLGIAPAEHKHIFSDGFRGSAAHELGAVGSGVGLTYSRELMRQYGGDLKLQEKNSDGGPGATFVLLVRRA